MKIKNIIVKCSYCHQEFFKDIGHYNECVKLGYKMFCSQKCNGLSRRTAPEKPCSNCSKLVYRRKADYRKNKSKNVFCSQSCAATYNNKHKKFGTRISKLELHLQQFIKERYPYLEVRYNSKAEIGSELDIYFPSLDLGIELNGIYHYEPIHGNDKLTQIQNNDKAKLRACDEKKIDLIIIPNLTKHLNNSEKIKYQNIISNIIDNRS